MGNDQHPLARGPVTHVEAFIIFPPVDVANGSAEADKSNVRHGLKIPAVV